MTNKKRILFLTRPICPPWDDAMKNFPYDIARNIKNFEIILLTCKPLANLPKNIIQKSIYSSPKWDWVQKIRSYIFPFKEIFVKKAKNFDILHSFFTPTKLNIFALGLLIRNKKLKTIQTVTTLREDLYSNKDIKKILYSDIIITYSDYAKDKLEKLGFTNVKRIYPGINLNLFSPASKNLELMKKYKTNESDFVINYTGEYVRLGDMDDIVSVFSDLAKENKNFKLHLAVRVKNQADANKKKEVKKEFEKAGMSDRVAFIDDGGYTMNEIYNLCDISIFPVRTMAGKFDIPLAVIEAMACGKPVIASNIERLRHFLNNDNSILVNPGDRAALKEKILYLYNNPEARGGLGKKGMRFARENFDISKVVEEYENVYRSL